MSTNRGRKLAGYVFAGIAAAGAYVGAHYLVSGQLPGQPSSYRSSPEPFEDLMVSSAADSFLNAPNAEQLGQNRTGRRGGQLRLCAGFVRRAGFCLCP